MNSGFIKQNVWGLVSFIRRPVNFLLAAVFVLALFYFSGCSAGRYAQKDQKFSRNSATTQISPPIGTTIRGTASYYGDEFIGRVTTSGSIYDPEALTGAHQSWPMGVKARITNLKNKRTVVIVINDRMPYHGDRILDLSRRAARLLGMLNDGLAEVRVEVIE